IYNEYGPTETVVGCTIHKFNPQRDTGVNVSIGKPIDNTQIYILNSLNQLQPSGISGELCIGGAGVAQGYLNRKELTSEKFIDNPFLPGTKMYRSGDLAKWLPDGSIEFIGRTDH